MKVVIAHINSCNYFPVDVDKKQTDQGKIVTIPARPGSFIVIEMIYSNIDPDPLS